MAMISALVLTLLLMACGGSNKPENMLIGNWLSNYNDIAIFDFNKTPALQFDIKNKNSFPAGGFFTENFK